MSVIFAHSMCNMPFATAMFVLPFGPFGIIPLILSPLRRVVLMLPPRPSSAASFVARSGGASTSGTDGFSFGPSFPTLPASRLERAERLEQLRFLENGFTIYVEPTDFDTIGVDTHPARQRYQ